MDTKGPERVRTDAPGGSKLLVGSTLTLAVLVAIGLIISSAWVTPAHRTENTVEIQPSAEVGPLAFRTVTRIRPRTRDLFDANSKRALRADIRSSLARAQHDLSNEFQSP